VEKKTKAREMPKDFIIEEIPEDEIESEVIYEHTPALEPKPAPKPAEKTGSKKGVKTAVFVIIVVLAVLFLVWMKFSSGNSLPVAAFVNGNAIYNADIDAKYNAMPDVYKQLISRDDLINRTIDELLVKEEITRRGISASKDEIDGAFKKLLRVSMISQEQFDEYLKNNNLTREGAMKSVEESLLLSKFVNETMHISVSDAEIDSYYADNKAFFSQPESRNVSHMLICYNGIEGCKSSRIKEEAVKLINELLVQSKTEDFGKLAFKYSDCPSSSVNGNLGIINEDSPFVEAFKNAALKLDENEISGVVETEFGMHLIKVNSIIPAKTIPLKDVRNEISAEIKKVKTSSEMIKLIAELRAKSSIVILGKNGCDGAFFYTADWCAPCNETAKLVDSLISDGKAIRKVNVAGADIVKTCFKSEMKEDIPQLICKGNVKTGKMAKEEIAEFVENCK
jgi:peptidyl-prolyl cis-trans isomerase C